MKLMKLNIQLFADEADNTAENGAENIDASVQVDQTKAFSNRLNEKTKEIENAYNNKLASIAKKQGYNSWEEYEEACDRQLMDDIGVNDPDKFQKLVNSAIDKNPEVIKAREIIKKTEQEQFDREIKEQISMINKLDKSVKTLDDLAKDENFEQIRERVKKGYGLYDAYVLSNMDKITTIKEEGAVKKALENVDSKSHLRSTLGGNSDEVKVPKEVYEMYKRNLKWDDEKIRAHYTKTLKEDE